VRWRVWLVACATVTATQREKALLSRSDIDMAKGALIALHGCDPGEAFARLVDESQRRNIKLRDVALEMLDRMRAPRDTPLGDSGVSAAN
jgi:AmiR/NasT family two-component response regulator